ncbi:MAG: hypothetical protein FWG33_04505 [Oscillospiraceae bacterium]|nr:hypothetical protein [Oscillospiraceae bacterium]
MMKRNSKLYMITALFTTFAMIAGMFVLAGCSENTRKVSYESAERALIKNAMSEYSVLEDVFQKLSSNQNNEKTLTLSVTPKTFIADLLGVTEINPTVFEISGAGDGNDGFANIIYKNGTKEILSGDFWVSNRQIIMSIPQLLDKVLFTDTGIFDTLDENIGYNNGIVMSSFSNIFNTGISGGVPEIPSENAINALITAALDEYFALTADMPAEKDVEIDINGTAVNTEKIEIEITDEMVYKITVAVLNEVQNNQEVKAFINEIADMVMPHSLITGDSGIETMISGIISETETALETITEPEINATMAVYISGSDIVKRVITPPESQAIGDEIAVTTYKNKNDYFTEVIYNVGGNHYSFIVSGNKKSGEFSVAVDGIENYKVEVNGTCTDGKKGSFNGEITVNGINFADIALTWSDKADSKPAPALDSSDSINLNEPAQLETIGMELLGSVMSLADTLDDDGVYDIIGLLIQQNLLQGFGAMSALGELQDWGF